MNKGNGRRLLPALLGTTLLVSCSVLVDRVVAGEQPEQRVLNELRYDFDISAKPLPEALREFSRTTGMSIAINRSEAMMLVGVTGRPVRGNLTADEALAAMTAR